MSEQPGTKDNVRRHPSAAGLAPQRWSGSPEEAKIKRKRNRWLMIAITSLMIGVPALVYWWFNPNASAWWLLPGYLFFIIGLTFLVSASGAVSSAKQKFEEFARTEAMWNSLRVKIRAVSAEPSMSELLELNRDEMQRYHRLTIDQADKSYYHSRVAMYGGLVVLALCIVLVVLPVTNEISKVSVAALGSISTVVTGYIAKTFLKSHRMSIDQLNNFYNQPLISSYLLTAERVALKLPEPTKGKTLNTIVDQALKAAGNGNHRHEDNEPGITFPWLASRSNNHHRNSNPPVDGHQDESHPAAAS